MQSVKTALRIYELVAKIGEAGVSEIAREVDEPKSTVQRNLLTLYEAGWLKPVLTGNRRKWALTVKVVLLANRFDALPNLREIALPQMQDLRSETQETIHLMLRDGDQVVLIERLDSPRALRTVRSLGSRAPLHIAANGKAVLASLDSLDQDQYLSRALDSWTTNSITDPAKLQVNLAEVKKRGYAFSDGELDKDIRAVAAPIFNIQGRPAASLSISCPASRLLNELVPTYGKLVADAAAVISDQLQTDN